MTADQDRLAPDAEKTESDDDDAVAESDEEASGDADVDNDTDRDDDSDEEDSDEEEDGDDSDEEDSDEEDSDEEDDGDDSDEEDSDEEDSDEEDGDDSDDEDDADEDDEGSDRSLIFWVLGLLLILGVELFIYGKNGEIQVCAGIEGVSDFSLVGQKRTPENFRRYPICVERLNLGIFSSTEEVAKQALDNACGRATVRRGPEAKNQCIRKEKNWKYVVKKEHIPPWDERLYRRLLWLD